MRKAHDRKQNDSYPYKRKEAMTVLTWYGARIGTIRNEHIIVLNWKLSKKDNHFVL